MIGASAPAATAATMPNKMLAFIDGFTSKLTLELSGRCRDAISVHRADSQRSA